jgi:hypothetical protein
VSAFGNSNTPGSASSAPGRESLQYGFRIIGSPVGDLNRSLVASWDEMLQAYCGAEPCVPIDREAYSSPWRYSAAFARHMDEHRTTAGYRGVAGASVVLFDIDRDPSAGGLPQALADARLLVLGLVDRLGVPERDLGVWYSGSKGFHLAVPTGGWDPPASATLPAIAERFAVAISEEVGLRHPIAGEDPIDRSVLRHIQPIRLPNTPHPKTGLRKRWIEIDDLLRLDERGVRALAADPIDHELPTAGVRYPRLAALWNDAAREVEARREASDRGPGGGSPRLNPTTVRVLRDGIVPQGSRHSTFWGAARNFRERGFTLSNATDLLLEPMRDSGLPESEALRILRSAFDGGAA